MLYVFRVRTSTEFSPPANIASMSAFNPNPHRFQSHRVYLPASLDSMVGAAGPHDHRGPPSDFTQVVPVATTTHVAS